MRAEPRRRFSCCGQSSTFCPAAIRTSRWRQGLKNYFDQRYVEAEEQLRTAAQHGSGLAANYLASMYHSAYGVKQDDVKALDWALRGAKLGDARAQNYAGYLLANGHGTKQDDTQALQWYLKSADQGFGPGAYNAALFYQDGRATSPRSAQGGGVLPARVRSG